MLSNSVETAHTFCELQRLNNIQHQDHGRMYTCCGISGIQGARQGTLLKCGESHSNAAGTMAGGLSRVNATSVGGTGSGLSRRGSVRSGLSAMAGEWQKRLWECEAAGV